MSVSRFSASRFSSSPPLPLIVAYIVVKFDPTMPPEIQQAVVGAVIAGGSMALSWNRNRKHAA